MTDYKPGTYVKGDDVRTAKNVKQAVALVFEGFKLKETEDKATDEAKPASGVTETPESVNPEGVTAESDDDAPNVNTTPTPAEARTRTSRFNR